MLKKSWMFIYWKLYLTLIETLDFDLDTLLPFKQNRESTKALVTVYMRKQC